VTCEVHKLSTSQRRLNSSRRNW